MKLYQSVKAAVPLRAAAERYGLRTNWSGMARCLFHEDHSPSMKLNETYFYCFGCGTHGDVIDLTAAIFQIPAFDAALKLARDFHVRVDRDLPPGKEESPPLPKGLMAGREKREQLWTCLRVLCEYQLCFGDGRKRTAQNPRTSRRTIAMWRPARCTTESTI